MRKHLITWVSCLFIIPFVSCSSAKNKNNQDNQEKQRAKKIDLDLDRDVENKFIIREKEPGTTINNKPIKSPEKVKAGVNLKDPKQRSLETLNKPLVKKEIISEKTNEIKYPKKFPQKYKDYDKQFNKTWNSFDPSYLKIGEKIKMRVSYLGLGMGSINLEVKPEVVVGDKQAFSFHARVKTAAFYSYIYELDDSLKAHVEKNEFLPLKYELIQRESKKEIDDIQFFDHDKRMLYYRYRRWRKDKKTLTKRKEDIFIPKYAIDPFSLLYFVRGLPLKTGRNFSFPIVTRDKLWVVKVVVGKQETIKTAIGKRAVYKVTAQIGEGGSFIKKGAIELWFDVADGHMIWKLRVGTKIGSLYAKVESLTQP